MGKFYQNGRLVSTKFLFGDLDWVSGALSGLVGGVNFKGLIDTIDLYSTELSESQVKNNMFSQSQTGDIASFHFEESSTQKYYGDSEKKSSLMMGTGIGFDQSDPDLRFSTITLANGLVSKNEGGLIRPTISTSGEVRFRERVSLEIPPFVVESDFNASIELLDAKTPGYIPQGIKKSEILLNLHPQNGVQLSDPGVLTIPLRANLYNETGNINLFRLKKSNKSIFRIRPSSVDLNSQIATFPISEFGSYFSTYDVSFIPEISYTGDNISDSPFNFQFDRRIISRHTLAGDPPYSVTIEGSQGDADLYYGTCNSGVVMNYQSGFPISVTNLAIGKNVCSINYKKRIGNIFTLYEKHLLLIHINE